MSGHQFQEDVNTSVSWDLVDTDTDTEVANINSPSTHQTVTNKNCADSSNESQNHTVGLNHQLNTLYNQDFFVADTTGRRLSQIADKSNYPSLLPNGNAALQLRLPDLLIYLKTDTYLVDVKSGHHYAMYPNRIEKMSVLPKLYAAWPYRQLLQTIHDDAVRFGVNSPEPTTSKQSAPAIRPLSPIENAEPAQREQQPSPCKPTIVKYEPPSFNLQVPKQMFTRAERNQVLQNHVIAANATFSKVAVLEDLIQQEPHNAVHYREVQRIQRNQHIQVAIKLQHILEADDKLREAAGLPQLDLPEHLWTVCIRHHLLTPKLLSQMYTFSRYNWQSSLHYNLRTDCSSILWSIQREGQPDRNHTVVMTPCRVTRLHHPKYSLRHQVYQNLPSHQHHM